MGKKKKKKKKKRLNDSQIEFDENDQLDTAEQFFFQEIKSPSKEQNDLVFEGGLKKVDSTRDFENSL